MPANLTAEAKAKWNKAQQVRTTKEKIMAFQEFLSAIPKHKAMNTSEHRQNTRLRC